MITTGLEYRFATGDLEALSVLWERHKMELVSRAVNFCGNYADAEDALQDAAVKFSTPSVMSQYDPDRGRWVSWAHAIVRRNLIDRHRSVQRQEILKTFKHNDPLANTVSPLKYVMCQEFVQALRDFVANLPSTEQHVLLTRLKGGTLKEAALEVFGDPNHNLAARPFYRATRKLHEVLASNWPGETPQVARTISDILSLV